MCIRDRNTDFGAISFAGQALAATIRGIGFSDFEKSFEPAVGVSIDGVFQAFSTNSAIDSFDSLHCTVRVPVL